MKSVNWPDDLEGVNDAFFNRINVQHCLGSADPLTLDYSKDLLGGTVKEKMEALVSKLKEYTLQMTKKGAKGFFWLVCSDDMVSMFENTQADFRPVGIDQMPLGYDCILYMGTLNKRWRIYQDPHMNNTILIGAGFSRKSKNYYSKVTIENM